MSSSPSITETVILYLREGVKLDDDADASAAAHAFRQGLETIKAQPGFIRQFWGSQVEDPNIFIWCIDWDSKEHHTAFTKSETYKSFLGSLGQVFDFQQAAPIQTFTRFISNPTKAFAAAVTEMTYYAVLDNLRDEIKSIIEAAVIPDTHPVITIGGSSVATTGLVFDTLGAEKAAPEGQSLVALGVLGYGSFDKHVKWRQTRKHAQNHEMTANSPLAALNMESPNIPGGKISTPDACIFHVKFRTK